MLRKLCLTLVIVGIPIVYFLYMQPPTPSSPPQVAEVPEFPVRIGNVPIRVEVADTEVSRNKGLDGRNTLGATNGMLFVFDKSDYHKIWMKDMRIPIDVIWIDEHFTVIDLTRELRPDTYPKTFEPSAPARFAIETNARYAESFGIAVGDKVTLPSELIPKDLLTE